VRCGGGHTFQRRAVHRAYRLRHRLRPQIRHVRVPSDTMIDNKRVLAIVPARGGSKGVPRKNIRVVAGEPLIGWTIRPALASRYIDRIIVSSEDDEICAIAARYGSDLPLKRPAEFATDDASSLDVVLHALDASPNYDIGVLLQPTSPLRRTDDIDDCISLMVKHYAASCMAVTEATENPYWMYRVSMDGRLSPLMRDDLRFSRRQDQPRLYLPNGALYAFQPDWLRRGRHFVDDNTIAYVMPAERSLDIDTEADMILFEQIVGYTR
jgi:CMP-N,N'-diacetyllegionaminic acid synthase